MSRQEQSEGEPGGPANKVPKPRGPNVMMIVVIMLCLYMVYSLLFGGPMGTRIAYSRFKTELRKNNVAKLTAAGDLLAGEFKAEVLIEQKDQKVNTKLFQTVHPKFKDPELMTLLDKQQVELEVVKDDAGLMGTALLMLISFMVLIFFCAYMARRTSQDLGGFFSIGRSRAKLRTQEERPEATFDMVAGLEGSKLEVTEVVDFLRHPEKYKKLGGKVPRGILLTGPPGTGKTLLARAAAGEAGVPFLSMSGSEFIEMFVGVGASRVRDLFEKAKRVAPSIVFIDEIDAVGRTRGTGLGRSHDEREQTLNQLLSEMDGFEMHQGVVILAATNRPDVLDPALLRPGRFDRQIVLPLPERDARRDILRIHSRGKPLAGDVDLDEIARGTPGFSGADLENLLNESALLAARHNGEVIRAEDLTEARDKVMMGARRPQLLQNEQERRRVALHEAGHALLAHMLPKADPLHKVTIIPRGRSLGVTQQLPEEDRHNYPKDYLLDRITMALGGRVAEELVDAASVSSGAENDFEQVNLLARKMVCRWGMSERLGPLAFNSDVGHPFLGLEMQQPRNFSENTAAAIDQEVHQLVMACYGRARKLLEENRDSLERLAEALLEHESLTRPDVEQLCREANGNGSAPTGA